MFGTRENCIQKNIGINRMGRDVKTTAWSCGDCATELDLSKGLGAAKKVIDTMK